MGSEMCIRDRTPDVQTRYPAPFYEPISTLGWMAGITEKMEIGTTVIIAPYRNVLELARACANVDQLSGGRLILGVGVGWAQQEFKALGVPFRHRAAITNEILEAIDLLWTQDMASYDGRFVSFQDVNTAPRPVRLPKPPIWVGGASDQALRRTVRYADGWHPIRIRVDWLKGTGIPRLTEIAAEEGRPVPAICPRIRLRITDSAVPEDLRVAGEGSVEQIRRDMASLEELGCQYVLLDNYYDDIEAIKNNEASWSMLAVMAEKVVDLGRETIY